MTLYRLLRVTSSVSCVAVSAGVMAQEAAPPVVTIPSAALPATSVGTTSTPAPPPTLESHEKDIQTLKTDVGLLKKAVGDKDDEGGDKEQDLAADFKSGKLIKYGITGGAALAVHIPTSENQVGAGASAMPYLALYPFWWTALNGPRGDITKAFCAESWLSGSRESAGDVADKLAEKLAKRRFDQDTLAKAKKSCEKVPLADAKKCKADAIDKAGAFPTDKDEKQAEILKRTGWDTEKDGRCSWGRVFGFYWGLPASYNTNGKAPDTKDTVKARDFKPVSSFGVAYAPVSAVSILVGYTWSHVTDDAKDADTTTMPATPAYTGGVNHTVHSVSVSVGGNLDLVGVLFGGK